MRWRPVIAILLFVSLPACSPDTASSDGSVAAMGGGVLRVVMDEPAYQSFDPQGTYTFAQWEILRCCLIRTLMTYPGVPDFAGTQPVPDLAVAPPSVSADGMTWTFRMRTGIHYAPPLQEIEVTSGDIVRALLRAGIEDAQEGQGTGFYLRVIEGYSAYAEGDATSISGVSTPDAHTIVVQEARPDLSIAHLFATAMTAPIPPLPADPSAVLGAATGHPFGDGPDIGYGPFLVATGPYMFAGSEDLDFSVPPEDQTPIAGRSSAAATLVRNPSWDPATDPNRPAYADQIHVAIEPLGDPYRMLDERTIDVVMGGEPPDDVIRRYGSSADERGRIERITGPYTQIAAFNLAQPPFEDVHVRRAVAFALDRTLLAERTRFKEQGAAAAHEVPDPMEGSLLASWDPFASTNDAGDLVAARREIEASSYGSRGRCIGPACHVIVTIQQNEQTTGQEITIASTSIRASLRAIGIRSVFRNDADCSDPNEHVALCVGRGWGADYPDPGNMFEPFLAAHADGDPTLLGATRRQLRTWGYTARLLPSIDPDYQRCVAEGGVVASMCWARLDQLLVGQLVAVIPTFTNDVVRLKGADVTAYSLDQAFGEPSLDRVAVVRSGTASA